MAVMLGGNQFRCFAFLALYVISKRSEEWSVQ